MHRTNLSISIEANYCVFWREDESRGVVLDVAMRFELWAEPTKSEVAIVTVPFHNSALRGETCGNHIGQHRKFGFSELGR